jgi:sigma-B regulation protein RsbU (phosphoserine phosphatase)
MDETIPVTRNSILVVEDDELVRDALVAALQHHGYDVVAATTGSEALARLAEGLPDLVLSDVNMPDLDGFALLARVREDARTRTVPFVFLTARGDEDDLVRGLGLGADDYLRTPVAIPELVARVRSKVERPPVPASWVEKEQVASEDLERAAEVQQKLLPAFAPTVDGYDVAGRCIPTASVAGDFFDWYRVDTDSLVVTVADVMGKGMASALLMATVRAVLRGTTKNGGVGEGINYATPSLERDLADTTTFVTLFHSSLVPATGRVRFVDAGHGLAIIVEAGATYRRLRSGGLPIGIGTTWDELEDVLAPGETLVVVSDGVLEGMGELTDEAEVHDALRQLAGIVREAPTAAAAVESVLAAVGAQPDDRTVVAVRRSL